MRNIHWPMTLWVNFLRSFFAGIVICIVMLISNKDGAYVLLLFPILYFCIILPIAWMLKKMPGSIVTLFFILLPLTVMAGDPFVYAIRKIKPSWVPLDRYNIINFVTIMEVKK